MKALQILVARVLLGEIRNVSTEDRERMEDMLLDTKEGAKMDGDDVDALSARQLAEKVFTYSFGRTLTKEHNGNAVMAARRFLQAVEDSQAGVERLQQEEMRAEEREYQRRKIFQTALTLPSTNEVQVPDQRPWVLLQGQVDYPFNCRVHHSIFQPGLVLHVLSQTDNLRYFYRVAETHNDNPNVIIVPTHVHRVTDTVLLESLPTFAGLDLRRLDQTTPVDSFQLMDELSDKMSHRVQFPPCIYVGQEVLPRVVVSALRTSDGVSLPYAAVPLGNVDISDVQINHAYQQTHCFVCSSVNATSTCGGCRSVTYCSDECHAFHWKYGRHCDEC